MPVKAYQRLTKGEFMSNNFKIALGIVLISALIAIGLLWPFAIVAALNTLFPILSIPYNFWSWLSVVVLQLSFATKVIVKK